MKPKASSKAKTNAQDQITLEILGGVHRVAPVSLEPVTVMSAWRLQQVNWDSGERTRHLVGRANREGRVCSDIRQFDLSTMTATTRSGRRYQLVGPPGFDRDAQYVFNVWLGYQEPGRAIDMTGALMRLLSQRGLNPEPLRDERR